MKEKSIVKILLLLFLLLLGKPGNLFSQFTFGLNGGLTYNGLTGDSPKDASYKRKIDFTAGLHMEYKVSNDIALGLGAGYYRTGTTITYDVGEKETVDSFDVGISYINIPVTFKVFAGGGSTYFSSGFDLKKLLNANVKYVQTSAPDKDIKDRLQEFEASVFVGFGGLITFGRPSLGLELRYAHSLSNINRDFVSTETGLPSRFRFTGFQLLMFFNWTTGKQPQKIKK